MEVQFEHDTTLEDNEYVPAAQAVHVDAPVFIPVFVMDPGLHEAHDPEVLTDEYIPASQEVHVVAPALVPVFVMDPAAHV